VVPALVSWQLTQLEEVVDQLGKRGVDAALWAVFLKDSRAAVDAELAEERRRSLVNAAEKERRDREMREGGV
jgi:folate-dependent phosphoribosylglycinamide formyltransferase PurN